MMNFHLWRFCAPLSAANDLLSFGFMAHGVKQAALPQQGTASHRDALADHGPLSIVDTGALCWLLSVLPINMDVREGSPDPEG